MSWGRPSLTSWPWRRCKGWPGGVRGIGDVEGCADAGSFKRQPCFLFDKEEEWSVWRCEQSQVVTEDLVMFVQGSLDDASDPRHSRQFRSQPVVAASTLPSSPRHFSAVRSICEPSIPRIVNYPSGASIGSHSVLSHSLGKEIHRQGAI